MLTLFFTFLTLAFSAHADIPKAPIEGHFELRGKFDYLDTSANFPTGSGSSTKLPNGGKFRNESISGQFAYDFDSQFQAFAGLSGGQVQADVFNSTLGATETHTKAGLSDALVGGRMWLPMSGFQLVPEVSLTYPMVRVDINSDDALLGEGALRAQGGAWLLARWSKFTPFGYLGYAFRDEGRSNLLPYRVGIRYGERRQWWIQAGASGYKSVSDDTNSANRTIRDTYLTHVDGGSYAFYSLNPSRTDLNAAAGMQFGNLEVYVALAVSAFGESTADSWTGTVGINFLGSLKAPGTTATAKRKNRFDTPTEQFDNSLFEESDVTGPANDGSLDEDLKNAPAETPPPPVKKKKRADPLPNVELLMKDTEKSLSKKPK